MPEYGYFALFAASFLSATLFPFSSEAVLSAMLIAGFHPAIAVLVATAGNWLGSMTTYALGYIGNLERIERWLHISEAKIEKFRLRTEKYGSWFGLLVWLPGIGDVIAVCLGLARTPVAPTAVMILIGKALRYIVLATLVCEGRNIFS